MRRRSSAFTSRRAQQKRRFAAEPLEQRIVLDSTVVFNELMYHPAQSEDTLEWVELYNQQAVDMDLSGWSLQGGVSFSFPSGTILAGGHYLVIGSNPAALQSATGISGVFGPYTDRLSNSGESVRLVNNSNRVMDELSYGDDNAWPVGPDGGGVSLAKRSPNLATTDASSWTASRNIGGTPGSLNFSALDLTTAIAATSTWRYQDGGIDLGTAWRAAAYDDSASGWQSGAGLFYYEDASLPAAKTTPLTPGRSTYYFRKSFNFTGDPVTATLQINPIVDDGAVYYLNGVEVYRQNMAAGTVTYSTTATPSVGDAAFSGLITIPSSALISGTNVLAVEVHQGVGTSSSGLVLNGGGLVLQQEGPLGGSVPTNLARQPGAVAFGTTALAGYSVAGINDGVYGNSNAWAGASGTGFVGISLGGSFAVNSVAFGRDNTGASTDRALGLYRLWYTQIVNPGVATAFTGDPTTGWANIGNLNYQSAGTGDFANPARRHLYSFTQVNATGIRLQVPATGASGTVIDELEINPPSSAIGNADVVFGLELTVGTPAAATPELVFNEVAAASAPSFSLELVNTGSSPLALGGYVIGTSTGIGAQYVLPAQSLAAGGILSLTAAELGFQPLDGDKLFLYTPGQSKLLDSVSVRNRLRGRSPDGTGPWLYPDVATFGSANSFALHDEIVINEVMYHPRPVLATAAVVQQTTPVALGATWKYDQSGVDLGTSWRAPGFNDTPWLSGTGVLAGGATLASYSDTILADAPIAQWRLGENPPTGTAVDTAPAAGSQNGTYSNTATRTGLIAGDANKAVDFNGSSSQVSGTGLTSTGVFNNDWTIEAWFVHDSMTQWGGIFSNNADGVNGAPLMTMIDTSTRVGINGAGVTADNISVDLGGNHYGKPVYAVITKTGGNAAGTNNITVYAWVDGVQLPTATGTTSWNLAQSNSWFIGRHYHGGPQILDGAIDEVAIYNRALSAEEVGEHFQAGSTNLASLIQTPITPGPTTQYFRTTFEFDGNPANTALNLRPIVDDGAVYYLNGVEIYRQNMPAGEISYSTPASSAVGNAGLSSPIAIPSSALIQGTNVLAVEVHQATPAGGDVVFGAELLATETLSPATDFHESPDEWIELYNRSNHSVDLSGWSLSDAVDYTIPVGTSLGAGQYLVIAKNAATLQAQYPSITVLGNFSGSLADGGENILLKDASSNPADAVRYFDDSRWPEYADGGGSSMELRDPLADNSVAEAWAASDEGSKSTWQTYTYRGVATNVLGPIQWNEFLVGMLDAGEVLLDDISVIESPSTTHVQLIQNGSFESPATIAKWRVIGNHSGSLVTDPTNPANHVMRLVANGAGEHMSNHAETTLAGNTAIVDGREYEISFRAKWIGGSNQLNTRLYFNRLPQTSILQVPALSGTPGAQNSTYQANIGPSYSDLRQGPVVPAAGVPVSISVKAADPQGIASMTLYYRVGAGVWTTTPMTAGAGGVYTGTVPGQAAASIVQFYVQGQDTLGAISTFPAEGANSRALYKVEDGQAVLGTIHNFRIIMTTADSDFMHTNTNLMSSDYLGATVVYDESEVYYNVGVRLKGSPYGRPFDALVSYIVRFNSDQLFRGVHQSVAVDRSGRGPVGSPGQDEILIEHFMNHAGGLQAGYDDLIRVIAPRSQNTSTALLQMGRFGSEFLDTQYSDGSDGNLYEFDGAYYTTTTIDGNPESLKTWAPGPIVYTDIQSYGDNKEVYRYHFSLDNNQLRDDYDSLIELGKAFGLTGAALDAATKQIMDVDQWMRAFASQSLAGNGDVYSFSNQHNLLLYERPEDGKFLAFPKDMDVSFNRPINASLWGGGNLAKIIELPANKRLFYGHLQDIINTTYNTTYMAYWTNHYGSLVGQNYSGILSYIGQRAAYVQSVLPAAVNFQITTNGGNNLNVNTDSVVISGDGWINVRNIFLAGRPTPLDVTWTDEDSWQVTVPLATGNNTLSFSALDYQGNPAGSDSIVVNTTVGQTAQDALRVTELMYHPGNRTPAEITAGFTNDDDFEYIEIQNTSNVPVNLAGAQIADGISFNFSTGSVPTLGAGQYVLVVKNLAAFSLRYNTAGLNIAGQYSGQLSNSGESISLINSLNLPIQSFIYSDAWYPSTDGPGNSLVVADALAPVADWNSAIGWRASAGAQGSPGLGDVAPASVVGRHVFYNNSKFDGQDSAANASDDAAIATDKQALLPGQTATLANYTSFSHGINGVMVDIANRPTATLAATDFQIRVGNDNTPGGWSSGTAPASVSVRTGAGASGSDRVTLIWPDGVIANQWIQITVLATPATGLTAPAVFYFGNAIGESGDSLTAATVNSTDEIGARTNFKTFLDPALIDDHYDFNRDGFVNATDQILARSNSTTLATSLKLISVPGGLQALTANATPPQLADDNILVGLSQPVRSASLVSPGNVLAALPQPLSASFVSLEDEVLAALIGPTESTSGSAEVVVEHSANDDLYELIAAELVESRL